jgi:hypothetical protein
MGRFLATWKSESAPSLSFHVGASWEYSAAATAATTTTSVIEPAASHCYDDAAVSPGLSPPGTDATLAKAAVT